MVTGKHEGHIVMEERSIFIRNQPPPPLGQGKQWRRCSNHSRPQIVALLSLTSLWMGWGKGKGGNCLQIFLDLEQMSCSKGCGIQVSVRRSPRSPSGTKASLGALSGFGKPSYSQLQFNTAKNVDYNQQKEGAQELGSEGIRRGTSSCLLSAESCRQHFSQQ